MSLHLPGATAQVYRSCCLVFCLLALVACASQQPSPATIDAISTIPESTVAALGEVELLRATRDVPAESLLSIGIAAFDGASARTIGKNVAAGVLTQVNQNEAKYLPYVLRNTLIDSNQWGVVRVLPESDPSVDLMIHGRIIRSDGQELELEIVAVDSAGREWLNRRYRKVATIDSYPKAHQFNAWNRFDPDTFVDPFQDIYDQIANDLVAQRASLDRNALKNVQYVSQLVYGQDLSPAAFEGTLETDESGLLRAARLLPANEPALKRVKQIAARHEIFIDSVDEYYAALFKEMQPLYAVWRRYSFDEIAAEQSERENAEAVASEAKRDTFSSYVQRYDRYRWSKIYQQEFAELAAGFNNEIAPAILELNERVYGLTGSMENQYQQWREILRRMFALETAEYPAAE